MSKGIVFVVAHPDDVEINAGGTVYNMCKKYGAVKVIICAECGEERKEEAYKALKHLGVEPHEVVFLEGHQDTQLCERLLAVELDKHLGGAHSIYTHHPHDTHQDHRAVSWAVQSAGRKCFNVFFFTGTYPSGRVYDGVQANSVALFDGVAAARKEQALLEHKSQAVKYGLGKWVEAILSGNKADAWKYGGVHGYAEVFQCARMRIM